MDEMTINIIDVIKEEQIKLGYRKEKIRLYYPLPSLNALLGTQSASAQMELQLKEFFERNRDIFGDVKVSYKGERFCILFPEDASEYVNNHTKKEGFLYDFIHVIAQHDIQIEDVLQVFKMYSANIHFEKMNDAEFDYLIFFEDGQPDSYRYCLTDEGHHLIYHRYTKKDYEELFG